MWQEAESGDKVVVRSFMLLNTYLSALRTTLGLWSGFASSRSLQGSRCKRHCHYLRSEIE